VHAGALDGDRCPGRWARILFHVFILTRNEGEGVVPDKEYCGSANGVLWTACFWDGVLWTACSGRRALDGVLWTACSGRRALDGVL
jgi:hypothetical protein